MDHHTATESFDILLIEKLPIPAYFCDPLGTVLSYSPAAELLWGQRPNPRHVGQWSGARALRDASGKTLPRSSYPGARASAHGKEPGPIELQVERADGSLRPVTAHTSLVRDAKGALTGVVCVLLDRTAAGQTERSEFLSMLAHELRNPLSPILSAACIMKMKASDPQIRQMAEMVERQVKQLTRFVTDLLDTAAQGAPRIVVQKRPARLGAIIDCAVDELAPLARQRGQRLDIDFADRDADVVCDPERVTQAIANVLINASTFTSDGGEVSLKVAVDGDVVEAVVKDNGIGIPAGQIEQIFAPYTHFAPHHDRVRAGAGVGLTIAQNICEQHGGCISAASAGRDRGSSFRLTLPIAASRA